MDISISCHAPISDITCRKSWKGGHKRQSCFNNAWCIIIFQRQSSFNNACCIIISQGQYAQTYGSFIIRNFLKDGEERSFLKNNGVGSMWGYALMDSSEGK